MATKRVSQLTETTAPASGDFIPILQTSTGQTKKVTVKNLVGLPDIGWTATGESWVFSSYSSTTKLGVVTVPSDATTKYNKGMWVRFSQTTGGTKYGMITAVTATTLTINMFSYTLTNEALSTIVYSPLARPVGVPSIPYSYTEANGWTVNDYGTERRIFRSGSYTGAVVAAAAFGSRNTGVNYPSGYNVNDIQGTKLGLNDQAIAGNINASVTGSVEFVVQNAYSGGSVTPIFVWFAELRVQL